MDWSMQWKTFTCVSSIQIVIDHKKNLQCTHKNIAKLGDAIIAKNSSKLLDTVVRSCLHWYNTGFVRTIYSLASSSWEMMLQWWLLQHSPVDTENCSSREECVEILLWWILRKTIWTSRENIYIYKDNAVCQWVMNKATKQYRYLKQHCDWKRNFIMIKFYVRIYYSLSILKASLMQFDVNSYDCCTNSARSTSRQDIPPVCARMRSCSYIKDFCYHIKYCLKSLFSGVSNVVSNLILFIAV